MSKWMSLLSTWLLPFAVVLTANASSVNAADPVAEARQIISESGQSGGFFVHLGCGSGELTSALRQNDATQVQGLSRDPVEVQAARDRLIRSSTPAPVYGDVAFDVHDGTELPYVDNLVNLLVAEDLGDVSMDEVLRVLTPNGVALVKENGAWKKTIKPRPDDIDDWSHYLHDASGNSVAHDDVVGPFAMGGEPALVASP
jgi:SAM-dependent methyltransferase